MQKWMVTKETKLKDVLKTPAGHDILAKAFYSLGLSEKNTDGYASGLSEN